LIKQSLVKRIYHGPQRTAGRNRGKGRGEVPAQKRQRTTIVGGTNPSKMIKCFERKEIVQRGQRAKGQQVPTKGEQAVDLTNAPERRSGRI